MADSRDQLIFAEKLRETTWLRPLLCNREIQQHYPWLAMDKNGKIYVYTMPPRPGSDIWISYDGSFLFIGLLAIPGAKLDFTQCCLPLQALEQHLSRGQFRPALQSLPSLPDLPLPDAWL